MTDKDREAAEDYCRDEWGDFPVDYDAFPSNGEERNQTRKDFLAGISYGRAHPDREMLLQAVRFFQRNQTYEQVNQVIASSRLTIDRVIDQFLASRTAQEKGG
jgi:hypothetical protein